MGRAGKTPGKRKHRARERERGRKKRDEGSERGERDLKDVKWWRRTREK